MPALRTPSTFRVGPNSCCRTGSTVFLTSHVLEIVERLCTHVGIIVKGKLVEQASLATIHQAGSLEDRFLHYAGAQAEATHKLNWLEEAAS